jgi:hypothetical protein
MKLVMQVLVLTSISNVHEFHKNNTCMYFEEKIGNGDPSGETKS